MEDKIQIGYPSIDKPWLKYYTEDQINTPLPHMTAYEYLKTQNADRLDYTAIDSEVGCFTYGELFAQIDATAKALWTMGIQKGKNVLSMFPVLPHESFLFYGIDAVGAALCQIAPQYTPAEVCNYANRIEADLFFVFDFILTPEMEQMVYESTKVRHIIVVNFMPLQGRDERTLAWDAFIAMGKDVSLPDIHREPGELLFLAGTGGSTGEPKSVMLSDDCFNLSVHEVFHSKLDYHCQDRWMRLWPLFSVSAAVANNHLPLCAGMRMQLRQFPMDISTFDQMVTTDMPNHLVLIPQLLDVLEASELLRDKDLSFIKTVGCGGLALTAEFEHRVNNFLKSHNIDSFIGYGWGSSECAAGGAARTSRETTKIGTSGAPYVNTIISMFDPDTGFELLYGEIGELCISAEYLMLGYWGDPELTVHSLRTHSDGKRWLHTGDLGTVDQDGLITITGRMSRVIFTFPTAKIYPQALESSVSTVEGVREVVFCQIADAEHDGFFCPVCFIVPDGMYKAEIVRENVRSYCEKNLPEHARPKYIYMRENLPLTKVGKPDVRMLEKEATEMQ